MADKQKNDYDQFLEKNKNLTPTTSDYLQNQNSDIGIKGGAGLVSLDRKKKAMIKILEDSK